MDFIEHSDLINSLKTIEQTRKVINLSHAIITQTGSSTMTLTVSGDSIQVLEEGVRDFCKLFGIAKGYFQNGVTATTLNSLFQELKDIKGIEKVQVLTTQEDHIVRMALEETPFIEVSVIAEKLETVAFLYGIPGLDIGFRMISAHQKVDVPFHVEAEYVVGIDIFIDFFGGKVEFGISSIGKEMGCAYVNRKHFKRHVLKSESTEVIASAIESLFDWVPAYADSTLDFVMNTYNKELGEVDIILAQAVQDGYLTQSLARRVKVDAAAISSGNVEDDFKEIGLTSLFNVYDLFRLISVISDTGGLLKARIRNEIGITSMCLTLLSEDTDADSEATT